MQLAGSPSQTIWLSALLVVLLFASALVSGSGIAFPSLTQEDTEKLKSKDSRRNRAALNLLGRPVLLSSTVTIWSTVMDIGAIISAVALLDGLLSASFSPAAEFIVKTVAVLFAVLIFGKILPGMAASRVPSAFVRLAAVPLTWLRAVSKPLAAAMAGPEARPSERGENNASTDDLQTAIQAAGDEQAEDTRIFNGILRFVNTEVVEVMKPRTDVIALGTDDDFDKVKNTVIESGYSRIPVYEASFDHIKGVLFIKDILPYIDRGKDFGWQQLLREPYYVPEYMKINDLLEDFQSKKTHLSIVVDEYGGTLGIVTLEDILEEIVGDIADESDREESCYDKLDDNSYLFEGGTLLGDFERILGLTDGYFDKAKGDADTLAGLMLEIRGEFLDPGDEVAHGNIAFRAEEVDHYRITKVKVTINAAGAE